MALTPYEKGLLEIVVSRAAGSDNSSVIDNTVRQVLKEKGEHEPGRLGYLKRLLDREAQKKIRQDQQRRPRLILAA